MLMTFPLTCDLVSGAALSDLSQTEAGFSLKRENCRVSAVRANPVQHGTSNRGLGDPREGVTEAALHLEKEPVASPRLLIAGGVTAPSLWGAGMGGHVHGIWGLESDPFLKCI